MTAPEGVLGKAVTLILLKHQTNLTRSCHYLLNCEPFPDEATSQKTLLSYGLAAVATLLRSPWSIVGSPARELADSRLGLDILCNVLIVGVLRAEYIADVQRTYAR